MNPESFPNLIGGQWTCAGATFEQRNPARLSEITGLWPAATREDGIRAIDAAAAAFPAWSRLTAYERAAFLTKALTLMRERRESIAAVLTAENGKTLKESLTEIDAAIREMDWQIQEGLRLQGEILPSANDGVMALSLRRPLGVATIISPWNFPFNVPGRKCTPALMAGNTCVFKPASLTPRVGHEFTRLLADAGLPPGVFNFVTGGGATVGDAILSDPRVKAISFTGSTDVGRHIQARAATIMARTQLELGGKNPLVVLADADLQAAADSAATAAFACAGQWCTSTSRVIVERPAAKEFLGLLLDRIAKIKVGDGADPATTMGPVCGSAQLKGILAYIEIAKAEGATLAAGGKRLTGPGFDDGCFVEPTLFTGVTPNMRVAREEIFGPVLCLMEAADFDEAIAIANSVEFGLASSIYTRDLGRAMAFLERTEVGLTHVNLITAMKEPQLSFGGVKASGFGIPEGGRTGIEFFTEHKVAYVKYR